ncbi:MAG: glycerophosphodiester phosphodiesterase [Bacteroidetes bacterium]|nr:glycerophosphodiester phosphodiesterase [Bacteroidota bacterium]MCW5895763.1 glycerophosphodiester phosphodiesterase [Bacteroidota bacterium]
MMYERIPLIVAHRGSSGVAPENTLAAFRQAIADGADMIELDVRMTKDFELVVLHDRSVNRTTNGKGKVRDLTLADLRSYDAGSWFGRKFSGERIPSLREVIDILPHHVNLNIEVKTDGETRKRIAFEESLLLVIREKNFARRVLVSSFDHKFLRRYHALDPTMKIGALYFPLRDAARKPSTLARRVGASVFICSVTQLRKSFIDDAERNGIALACYGVNSRRQLAKARQSGVKIVVTDYPKEIRKLLRTASR